MLFDPIESLGRNEDAANNLENPVPGDAIFNDDRCESIDFNTNQSTVAGNIYVESFPVKESWEIDLQDSSERIMPRINYIQYSRGKSLLECLVVLPGRLCSRHPNIRCDWRQHGTAEVL